MRILGFSKKWDKLNKPWYARDLHTFTTFRYPRRDRDWEVEEVVQVVFKPRSKERQPLGIARIIRKQEKDTSLKYYLFGRITSDERAITPNEAYEDGFSHMGYGDVEGLKKWLKDMDFRRFLHEHTVYKLTLYWIERFDGKG